MQETPQCAELFRTLLNPEMPYAEVDASAAMMAAARETRLLRPADPSFPGGITAKVWIFLRLLRLFAANPQFHSA